MTSRRPPLTPRKQPRQERSRATVEAILAATSQVLVRIGYAKLTTTEVARVAGVSVGSLYQYFPAKDSLVIAVLEAYLDELYEGMAGGLAASGPSLDEQVHGILRGLLEAKASQPALSVALRNQVPRLHEDARVRRMLVRAQELLAGVIIEHRAELARLDATWTAGVVTNAVDGVVSWVLEREPRAIREPRLLRDLCRLVLGYLRPQGPPE